MVNYRATYDHSWAVIIGIDQYQAMPPLSYAVSDARAVAELLATNYGFDPAHMLVLENAAATQDAIRAVIDERLTNPNEVGKDDRVLFFFAGHGVTRHGQRGDVGYIAPVDAQPGAWRTLIGMDDIVRAAEFIPAKHIFFIMDACYSGLALLRGMNDRFSEDMVSRQAWQVLTAGKANQPVADGAGPYGRNSLFTSYLLEGLRDQAADERGVISGSSLMYYVYRRVSNDSRSTQTPHYGWLRGDGDFVFRRASPQGVPPEAARALASPLLAVRLSVIPDLAMLATGKDEQLATLAMQSLSALAQEDSESVVRLTAAHALNEVYQIQEITRPHHAASEDADPTLAAAPARTVLRKAQSDYRPPSRSTTALGGAVLLILVGMIVMLYSRSQAQDIVIAGLQTQIIAGQELALATLVEQQDAALQVEAAAEMVSTKQALATATGDAISGEPTPIPLPATTLPGPTLTATVPVGTLTAALIRRGEQIFSDDFEADTGRWEIGRIFNTNRTIENGQLHIRLEGQYSLWFAMPRPEVLPRVGDFILDVDAAILTPGADGALVIAFRVQPPLRYDNIDHFQDYYFVGVDLGGNYFIFKQFNGQPGIMLPLSPLPGGPLVVGEPVHITLVGRRGDFILYVDGIEVGRARDLWLAEGRVALAAWSRNIVPFEVAFDNFSLVAPPEES